MNSINLLMGIGIISIPFAFSKLGWLLALGLLCLFSLLAAYTATLLGILMKETQSRSIHDIAELAFGRVGRLMVGGLFTAELITASVAMLILFSNSLVSLFPSLFPFSRILIVVAWILLLPLTVSGEMNKLTYLSSVGVLSLVVLVSTILFNGLTTSQSPGSLLNPMPTSWQPMPFENAIVGIGLLFVGLDGHAVFPSILTDMKTPHQYTNVISLTYLVVMCFYALIGVTGYLMFGNQVKAEVFENLSLPQYSQNLVKMTLGLMALNPLTKFPLIMIPVNRSIEGWIGCTTSSSRKKSRCMVTTLIMVAAISVPSFLKVMGFMGASLSFLIAGVVPIACYLALKESKSCLDTAVAWIVLIFVLCMMTLGTLGVAYA
jgi:amino acid permease